MLLLVLFLSSGVALTPAGRVDAARAVERARYAFVVGAARPFDELYPLSIFEQRVARELAEEAVLERVFGSRPSPAVVAAEFDRIETTTKAPEQWHAIKSALGNDRRRVEEAFCRPLVVQRALRTRFAFDPHIHARAHEQARRVRVLLLAGRTPPGTAMVALSRCGDAAPTTDELLRKAQAEASSPRAVGPPDEGPQGAASVDPETAAVLERQLRRPGDVSTILEYGDGFHVYRLVAITEDAWTVEAVRVQKVDFDRWLEQAQRPPDPRAGGRAWSKEDADPLLAALARREMRGKDRSTPRAKETMSRLPAGSTVSRPTPTPHRVDKTGALVLGLAMAVFSATPALAEVRLDPANPLANFSQEGSQPFIPGRVVLTLLDQSVSDAVNFYAADPDAAPGIELDLFAAFQITSSTPNNAETGVRMTINDGQLKAIVVACVSVGGQAGIGLAAGDNFSDPANYPVFVPVDWTTPTTVRVRRNAAGDAEIMEVNGVAPSPRAVLLYVQLPPRNRVDPTVEFGSRGVEALVNVDFTQFYTERPLPLQVIVPVDGGAAALTPVTINAGAGDQYDPHVSGDWVSYASNLSIHYYSFATGIDAEIPMGSSARDLLSDVSGSQIVFSRIITGVKTAVMVFDAATEAEPIEVDAAAATTRLGSAIGGDTVAYIDSGLHAAGELVIHDLAAPSSLRITNDTRGDQNPQVSPDGNVVTWEHCVSSLLNCDIWQAVKNGPAWDVDVLSSSANPEANPDTNGTLVVYDSMRNGNADIFWKPAAGGAEVQLQMPGIEANPSIAADFISFESRPTLFSTSDIFVYDRVKNEFFRITDTPLVTEQLNDITVLADGRLRVVWTSDEDGFNQRNVKAATLTLPDRAPTLIADLIALVTSFNFKQGIENSLDAKLQNVLAALDAADAGDTTTACNKLDAFVNEVQAQTGKAITTAQADQLVAATNDIKAVLGCP